MTISSSNEPADKRTSPAGAPSKAAWPLAGPEADGVKDKTEPPRRHCAAFGHFPAEAGVAVEKDNLRSRRETVGDERVEYRRQVRARRRGQVDDPRIGGPGQAGGGASVVPDDPDAGRCGRHRWPRPVGSEHHIGPSALGGRDRGSSRRVGVNDLQGHPGALGPQAEGDRSRPPESGQRARQRRDQDRVTCRAVAADRVRRARTNEDQGTVPVAHRRRLAEPAGTGEGIPAWAKNALRPLTR